jgi:serine/threonine protein kinase/Tol biopolymer transport system component
MNSSDWNHLAEWYSVWLSTDVPGRVRLRAQLAREQPALVGEADALVESSGSLPGFLETPAFVLAAHEMAEHTLTLSAGDRVGPYRIVELLAEGGMGVVYRATDVRLDRDVALKMMTYAGWPDGGRVDRFLQEARLTASLDHPNVVKMFDVGMFEGRPYLVAELIDGETLRERLARGGALESPIACRIGAQIAHGLVAAHARGLVHRDLKPENIIITRSGDAKILDFGIAKLAEDPLSRGGSATLSGVLLGTAGYLAPEQILGAALDGRADLFALGSMLFEMLTGARAFARAHVVDTLHAILHEPPPDLLRSHVPPRLAAVVQRLLEREPSSRFQSAADLAWALENVDASSDDALPRLPVVTPPSRSRAAVLKIVAAAVIVLGILGATIWRLRPTVGPTQAAGPLAQFTWTLPEGVSLESAPIVAPDQARLVFVGAEASGRRLFARDLSSLAAVAIAGTEGARQPFWAPDGQSIGYFSGGKLMKVALTGGAPIALAAAPDSRGGTWNAAGVILFQPLYRDSSLFRVSSSGGTAEPVTRLDEAAGDVTHKWPVFLPDGDHFLFQAISLDDSRRGIYLARLGDPSHSAAMLFRSETGAAYVPLPDGRTGFIVSAMGDHIEVRRFDHVSLTLQGDARVLRLAAAAGTLHHEPMLGASRSVLAFSADPVPWGAYPASVDLDGSHLRLWPDAELGGWLRLSPDGRQLLRTIVDPLRANPDIWVEDLARGTRVRVTTSRGFDVSPVWSRDGRRIAFRTGTVTKAQLAIVGADGTGPQAVLPCPTAVCEPTDWSPDGRLLAINAGDNVWTVAVASGTPSIPLLSEGFVERDARFSPDGRWIAYVSEESGRPEVSVRSLTGAPNRLVASSGGGDQPVWARNGRELFYVGPDGRLHSVTMRAAGVSTLIADAPKALNVPPLGPRHWGTVYDVSPDGRRVFLPRPYDRAPPREIGIVLNWTDLVR